MAKSRKGKQQYKPHATCNENHFSPCKSHGVKGQGLVSFLESIFPVVAALCLWQSLSSSETIRGFIPRWRLPKEGSAGNGGIDLTTLMPTPHSSDLEEALQLNNSTPPAAACRFVMEESMLPGDSAGWGIFSLVDLEPNDKILFSDMRIQLVDVPNQNYEGLAHLVYNYSWKAKYGNAEGTEVQTIVPGMSMLSNTGWDHQFQAVANIPTPPEPGTDGTRGFPEAGSFTHYHNRQFFANQPIQRGQEILVTYGQSFVEHKLHADSKRKAPSLTSLQRSLSKLQENRKSMCLDNIASAPAPGRGGRGAFATRDLPKGSVVAPMPVIPLNRTSLDILSANRLWPKKQLLMNYCYGHANSTLLLFAYSPVVNYINSIHYESKEQPNAVIRWSSQARNLRQSLLDSAQDIVASRRWGLLLEVVAIRDILQGEQILIDYGRAWHEAWAKHVEKFRSTEGTGSRPRAHVYASRLNQLKTVRTEDEQHHSPYPEHVEISCIYQYSDAVQYGNTGTGGRNKVTHSDWPKHTRMFPEFLRPCRVLRRSYDGFYTVEVFNKEYGYSDSTAAGQIPRGERHVVTEMPREAIRFTDKVYSTDQNLDDAFRHEIGLPDDVFPMEWMDLA